MFHCDVAISHITLKHIVYIINDFNFKKTVNIIQKIIANTITLSLMFSILSLLQDSQIKISH